MAGTLYLVPTPIGNLGDISRRIADTSPTLIARISLIPRITLPIYRQKPMKMSMWSLLLARQQGGIIWGYSVMKDKPIPY